MSSRQRVNRARGEERQVHLCLLHARGAVGSKGGWMLLCCASCMGAGGLNNPGLKFCSRRAEGRAWNRQPQLILFALGSGMAHRAERGNQDSR